MHGRSPERSEGSANGEGKYKRVNKGDVAMKKGKLISKIFGIALATLAMFGYPRNKVSKR